VTLRRITPIVCVLTLRMSASAYAATMQVLMENISIAPSDVTAKVGDSIEWVNKDIFVHTATARNGDWDFVLPPKKEVTLVLKKAGKIEYFCRFHPNMKATLTVSP
jgi:plastocyanin